MASSLRCCFQPFKPLEKRRGGCLAENNLKQIGLALHNYHDTFKSLPPASVPSRRFATDKSTWSWHTLMLPRMEQGPMYDLLQPNQPQSLREAMADPVKLDAMKTRLAGLICPSDTGGPLNADRRLDPGGLNQEVAKSNYLGCMGVDTSSPADGILYFNSNLGLRDILDGTSNTFAAGERSTLPIQGTAKPGAGVWVGSTTFPCAGSLPNDCTVGVYANVSFDMQSGNGLGALAGAFNSFSYSSQHLGGALFAMCDGSVRFVAETVESKIGSVNVPSTWGTYQKLGVRNDGEVVGDF